MEQREGTRRFVLLPILAAQLLTGVMSSAGAQPEPQRRQARWSGQIIDAESRVPLASAQVQLLRGADTLMRGRSDSLGRFTASGPYGEQYRIEVRRLGYLPIALTWTARAEDITAVVGMTAIPQRLEAATVVEAPTFVSARLTGFEYRARQRAGGSYILRKDIDEWHPHRTSDLMRRFLGVTLYDSAGVILAVSSRGPKVDLKTINFRTPPCVMRIGIDGLIKEWGFEMDAIDPNVIHGIEIYSGPATMPTEFNGLRTDSYCGLVMIWTRSGR